MIIDRILSRFSLPLVNKLEYQQLRFKPERQGQGFSAFQRADDVDMGKLSDHGKKVSQGSLRKERRENIAISLIFSQI